MNNTPLIPKELVQNIPIEFKPLLVSGYNIPVTFFPDYVAEDEIDSFLDKNPHLIDEIG